MLVNYSDFRLVRTTFAIPLALLACAASTLGVLMAPAALAAPSADSDWVHLSTRPSFWIAVRESSEDRKRETCEILHDAITVGMGSPIHTECHGYAPSASPADVERDRAAALSTGAYKYLFSATREARGSLKLEVARGQASPAAGVSAQDGTGFQRAAWTIEPNPADAKAGAVDAQAVLTQKRVEKFLEFDRHERLGREVLLARAVPASQRIRLNAKGRYEDSVTGQVLSFEDAWKQFGLERPKHKHYLRAGIEVMAVLGLGLAMYFKDVDINSEDWDLDWSIGTMRKKLAFEAVAFDSNRYNTNTLSHPLSGALFYGFPRANNLSVLESTLFAFAASSLWEYLCEYREKVSINDMVMTPVAGAAIGEVVHQLGAFFNRGAPNLVNKFLGSIFGGAQQFHNWMDKVAPERDEDVDALGFTRKVWHEFQLFGGGGVIHVAGQGAGGQTAGLFEAGIDTQIVNVTGWGQPGQVSRFLADGNFTQLLTKASFGTQGVQDFVFYVKAAMFGYYKQRLARGADRQLQGYSFIVAGSTAFDYRLHEKELHGGDAAPNPERGVTQSDQVAVVNVLGPTIDLTIHHKGLRVRMTVDVFGDFAALRSYAIEKYIDRGGSLEGMKDAIRGGRYYFAFGVTVASRLQASYRGFEAGLEFKVDEFFSTHGGERAPVTNDLSFTDQAGRFKAWLAYLLPGDRFKLQLSLERYYRAGQMADVSASRNEMRLMGSVIMLF